MPFGIRIFLMCIAQGYYRGMGPNRLSPSCPGVAARTINHIHPIRGTKLIKIQPPPLPMSCILLTATAIDGSRMARPKALAV